ncbi:hypothetical protein B0H14DRAFT_2603874 [Mycena olivaceomarginata]|nr:hypothetical protein B0H14DRAFT_2603874 [Mycena olivaceomarginata]
MSNPAKEELQEALKDAQLKLQQAVAEIKAKDIVIAQLQQNGGWKSKLKPNSSSLEYDNAIVVWAFGPYPEDGPPKLETIPEIEQVFKDPKLYLRYTRFMKQMGSSRSSTLLVFQGNLDKILRIQGIERNRDKLLFHANDNQSAPPTAYLPIFYNGLKGTLPNLFLNPVGPLSSLGEKGKAKPAHNTIGFQWKVDEGGLTVGMFHGVDTGNVVNEATADDMNKEDKANFALAMEKMAVTVDSDEDDTEDFDFEMGHLDLVMPAQQEPPASPAVIVSAVNAPANPANVNATQVEAAAAGNALQDGGAGGSLGRSVGRTVGRSMSETRDKGKGGQGLHGHGRGHGQAIASNDSDEPTPALRRGAHRT